jgi:hypothetical protein
MWWLLVLIAFIQGARGEVIVGQSGEVDGPIFTEDYSSSKIFALWEQHFQIDDVNERYKNGTPLNFLEIGCFEGRTSRYFLERILKHHPGSRLTCIDTFMGNEEHEGLESITGLYERYIHNTKEYKDKVIIARGFSSEMLKTEAIRSNKYDLIYVDANHKARHALEDAILSFPLLKLEGVMIFDDYLWSTQGTIDLNGPKLGIDTFLHLNTGLYEVVFYNYQVCIRKYKEP